MTPDGRDKLLHAAQRALAAHQAADRALEGLRERERRIAKLMDDLNASQPELAQAREAVREAQHSLMVFFGDCLDPVLDK